MRTRRSNFVSVSGLIFLAAIILIAAYFRLQLLSLFLGLILILCLISFLWARSAVNGISIEFEGDSAYAFPGESFDIGASLDNKKALLLMWLDFVIKAGSSKCTGEDFTQSFVWIMPFQRIDFRMKIYAERRGVLRIEEVALRSGDGFGLGESEGGYKLVTPFSFVVYPMVHPIDIEPLLRNMGELELSRKGLQVDKTLLNNIRDYRDGDSFRDINWRMLAKSDELMVNVHEKLEAHRVCFTLDFQSFTFTKIEDTTNGSVIHTILREKEFEDALSDVASYIVALHEKEVLCTLLLPGYAGRDAAVVVPEDSSVQIPQLLSALSEIDYSGDSGDFSGRELEALADENLHMLGQIYMIKYGSGLLRRRGGAYEEIQ